VSMTPRYNSSTAAKPLPVLSTVEELRTAASVCKRCHLWKPATQTVFGEGDATSPIMLIGEQPGDREDTEGRPFVGPAGRLLAFALERARIDREDVYVTNVVKHFKFELRGKRRLHKKPNSEEIHACFPWLESEIALIQPDTIVCLGATAAQALLGAAFRVTQDRGEFVESPWCRLVMATIHPSALLRERDAEQRERGISRLVDDLTKVRKAVSSLGESPRLH